MLLRPFQVKAKSWLSYRPIAFLALEQGLGKTVVASSDLIAPAVVICPSSMKWTWHAELAAWRPELKVQVISSFKDKVDRSCDVWIINYELLFRVQYEGEKKLGKDGKAIPRKRTIFLFDLPPVTTLIADESQYAKSHQSVRTDVVCRIIRETPRVRLLSGTPILNRPMDLWPLMYATGATKLGYFEFGIRYCKGWKTPWKTWDFSGASNLDELSSILQPMMLRLTKAQVLPELPEKTYRVVELDLPVDKREKAFKIEEIERNPNPIAFEALPDILHMNAQRKLPMAVEYIKNTLAGVDKLIIFAHHTDIVAGLMEALADFNPVRVAGGDSPKARHASVHKFQNDPTCRVFVGNIKAAGVGLTLTASSHVIFVESSWVPADIDQAADRAHRIGQKNAVTVEILTIHLSIDAHMLHSALRKMEIINSILKETDMTQLDTVAIATKLRELADLFAPAADAKSQKPQPVEADTDVKVPKPEPVESAPEVPAAEPSERAAVPASTASLTQPEQSAVEATIDQVREGMSKLLDAGKRTEALQILKDHGAAKTSELKLESYASVLAAIKKAMG